MEKIGILAHSSKITGHIARRPWPFALVAAASLLAMAGALATAPGDGGKSSAARVVEQLSLEGAKAISLGDSAFWREERVQKGDTVAQILSRLGIQDPDAVRFMRTSPETAAMHRQLAPGKVVVAETTQTGALRALFFPLNGKDSATLIVERQDGRLSAREEVLRYETQTQMKSAEIHSSLFAATDDAGIPDAIAIQLAEIFSGDIDFHRDLRKGDRFLVVYEMQALRGQPARSGRILSAEFHNDGKTHRAIYFEHEGKGAYYTPEGKNLRKSFLRSPLEFSRVTSAFAMRFHPILKDWRAHKGVDYGAPSGTKVRATGDGVVDFAGSQNGYGNLVILRHNGSYTTAYGHLKGFASGIRKGARVSQGDTVGYVGQTGWATGPHLHYEFRINGQQINPLAVNAPIPLPLEAGLMPHFKAQAGPQLAYLDLLRASSMRWAIE